MSGRKSKLLQSLEESVMPMDQEDAVRMIADHIRQPLMDPFEQSRFQGGSKDENLSVLHLADAIKFRDTMKNFKISPTAESLDEVMPVKNKDLDEMLELLIDDEDDDDEEEEDEYDEDEDDDTEGGGEDDVEDHDDGAEDTKKPHILRKWLDRFKISQ